ncbi:efflux RND transporter periplasmic adaptor subunit [Candidatus Falkowbacteria bacterium]|uniref:Uncharacterized protein n=1 Tax=Candidatus Falkowbacteria bacterium CG10_big_fil_rev_8_21_14_0_10_37_18 TaxID=1974562 RepID=A0A2H0V9D1_9BACT|nr:efflux RND transporter periplasmic adaptor subunit [Candidatus Falkowbacteria bacterium]NCQ13033.1 efflux RND transporter periplasmic adaptor subunit [Candidatus Falkowbacteria bacterium]PIR95714.1 MAG: hypothetical protein COT93_01135 [Candidatus Falkowbacteria bacterium CG10_big_fil_rev_8_21_14_0_10_37_18]
MNKVGFWTKKKIIWIIIIIIVGAGIWYFTTKGQDPAAGIQTALISRQNLQQTILTTGQVVSAINLDLSFQASGVVDKVNVQAGDKVKAGDVLATLSQGSVLASLTSAQGSLAQAQANYKRILSGSTPEQINVSEKSVASAQTAYDNAVTNLKTVTESTSATISQAEKTLTDLQSPTAQYDNKRSSIVVSISSQLVAIKASLDKQKQIIDDQNLQSTFGIANIGSVESFKAANNLVAPLLSQANISLNAAQVYKSDQNIAQAVNDAINVLNQNVSALNLCYSALQNSVVSTKLSQTQLDAYKSVISADLTAENSGISSVKSANQSLTDALTAATNAVTNAKLAQAQQIASAQSQVNSAQAAWNQASANLAQLKAKAQTADLEAARAQILSAQGSVDSVLAALNNTIIKAPVDGTITQVDTKVGEQASAMREVLVLQDISSLHAEAYASEANVASLQLGQSVDYTFDSLGPDKHFSGKILTINPASTVISGVVNYLVKASLPSDIPEIKPGMTVNMTVLVAEKNNVLSLSSTAIINQNSQKYVRVVDDTKLKTYHQVPVETGLSADGGSVEILSGLAEGQEVVTFIKK